MGSEAPTTSSFSIFARLKKRLRKKTDAENKDEMRECEKGEKTQIKDETQQDEKDEKKRREEPVQGEKGDQEEATVACKERQSRYIDGWCGRVVGVLDAANGRVVGGVEGVCGWWGAAVTAHPVRSILLAVLLCTVCSLGLLNVCHEERSYKLWFPNDSQFARVHSWEMQNFQRQHRQQVVLWTAQDNLLTAAAMRSMWQFRQRILNISVSVQDTTVTWYNICATIPSLPRSGSVSTTSIFSTTYLGKDMWKLKTLPAWEKLLVSRATKIMKESYCPVLEALPMMCYERSLLEVWSYDPAMIMNLTDDQVVRDINQVRASPVFGLPTSFIHFLGGVKKDATGRVVKARAALHTWVTTLDHNVSDELDLSNGDMVGKTALAWEKAFVKETLQTQVSSDLTPVPKAAHSLWMESAAAMVGDTKWVASGWVALIVYVLVTLGRPGPALVGIVCVGLAIATSYGICSALTIPFVTINSLLSILLLGLGVDDMYVIVAAWESTNSDGKEIAWVGKHALRKAGVAITFTSLTDALAFLVGSSTKLPALRWFCIYAATGITTIYLLQATVFLAALALDQHYKNASEYVVPPFQLKLKWAWKKAMQFYARMLVRPMMASVVVVAASVLAGVGLWGASGLRLEYHPKWLVPKSSYLHHWFAITEKEFPKTGEAGVVYFANVSFPNDLPDLHALVADLRVSPYIKYVDAWFSKMEETWHLGSSLSWTVMQNALSIFLHTPMGAHYTTHFAFQEPLRCGYPIPSFSAFKIGFQYQMLKSWEEQAAAMQEVKQIVAAANVSGYRVVWADAFNQWETDRQLAKELWQNLGVVVGVVGVVTAMMVGVGLAAVLVVVCVAATLVEVAALMHIWGLTVDTLTTIALVLAGGLCVDYAAHIAHAFLAAEGSRQTRAQTALGKVGPPILNAGLSTLLAFLVLAPTDSHLFQAFFKIFTGVSVLGMLHGLMVLPSLLALLG